MYQRDKGLCVTRANHHLSFFHTSSVHLYTHFNLSLCSVRHRSKFQTKCVCVCVCVFCSCPHLVQFPSGLFSSWVQISSSALLSSAVFCFFHIWYIFLIYLWKYELLVPTLYTFLNTSWLWPSFYLLLFYFGILYRTFSQVSDKHNIQPFFASVVWLLVPLSHFMSDFQATLSLLVRTVSVCVYI